MSSGKWMEQLVRIPFEDEHMTGILTIPGEANGHSVLIPWGAGAYPSSGRNRLRARFARHLAERGFHSLRFDYLGVGESTGTYRRGDLGNPFTQDTRVAAEWLVDRAPHRLLIVANCFGAWSVCAAASELPPTEGVCLINSPLGRDHSTVRADRLASLPWLEGMRTVTMDKLKSRAHRRAYKNFVVRRFKRWLGPHPAHVRSAPYRRGLDVFLSRNTRLLLLYGNDDFREDLDLAMAGPLGKRLLQAPTVRLVFVDERLSGCAALAAQRVLFEQVVPWLEGFSTDRLELAT